MSLSVLRFDSAREAVKALQKGRTHLLGGGTLVVRRTNAGDPEIETLVRWTDPQAQGIDIDAGEVRIGAMMTMAQVARHPAVGWLAPAARAVGGPTVRNMATVGGNLFAPSPYGDFAVALLALRATVSVQCPDGVREASLDEFFAQRGASFSKSIVTSVKFKTPPEGAFRYRKVSRIKPNGTSVMSIAAVLGEHRGVVEQASVAYGAMASTPIRSQAVERALIGQPLTADGIKAAIGNALDGTAPEDDAIASAWYRRAVLPVHLTRVLLGKENGR